MRPKSTQKDVPSTHDVTRYIHNQFVDQLEGLKGDIMVSERLVVRNNKLTTMVRGHPEGFRAPVTDGPLTQQRRRFLG
jgi:hypothetical protein